MTEILSSKTLMPIGLVVTIIGAAVAVGISFNQISANADDNDAQDKRLAEHETVIRSIDRSVNRGLILQENLNTLQARQARTQENISAVLNGQAQQILRLEILIERLSVEGGTAN